MNMISEGESPIQPVVTNSHSLPKKPRVMPWHWVNYYAYNWARKPKVWMMQRELRELANQVHVALMRDVMPRLLQNVQTVSNTHKCQECSDAYAALLPQVFLSQIEMILTRMRCSQHKGIFESFLAIHGHKFRRSEEIARWINGFK